MKIRNYKIYTLLFALFIMGCEKDKYLQDGSVTEGDITNAQIWATNAYARGILNNAYADIPEEYSMDGGGALRASGSDEAVNSNLNSSINTFNNGTWSPTRTVDNVYGNMYEALRKVNLFLLNIPTANIDPQDGLSVIADKARLRGEAYFLRAMFHFELYKRYGSFPIANRVFDRLEDLNLPKNTYQECVAQIVLDCDSAVSLLPEWTQSWSVSNRGRATQTAALSLKSRLLLYDASLLNTPVTDLAKWQKAADAAKAIIDRNKHQIFNNYVNVFNFNASPYNNEVIFATRANSRNDLETNNAPISYDGANGRTNPTQELVDAFGMANGKPITDATSGYNPANPYANRDPRLGLIINHNGRVFKGVAVQTYVGGKDGLDRNANATKTGYYMRKFLSEAVTWNQATNNSVRRPWVIFRYAETLLNYAEALNEAQGPVADVYKYLNEVRRRTGVNLPLMVAGAPLLLKDDMRIIIQNERRVELSFEGHRFFDVRRWKKGEEFFNKPVTGMRITNNGGTLTYTRFQVESRVFTNKNYFYPFSQSDINRQPALVQNTDW
ncbi:RagB/SusD family nutrient uptake outer membrane protein [Pedobacter cryophilus]|uniref:RagB/SusD family nutrient uptake outer membrane protein n=1 Tax=Pedobacter cryophilus TaxID=2571271 RepID=A0A4U1BZ00_9SPHI|nr:RagB/SusD family nutrient uptake outer membrane protein [Pedobacter cryophilus]TKB96913.1 RagB/SusD family nutrient uptake outer membrane protein [Pedobacter cryophilus]